VGRVDVGVAQARGLDLDKDLARAGLGFRHILEAERLGEIVDDGCLHGGLLASRVVARDRSVMRERPLAHR
jgi:hypothetical protein